MHTAYSRPGRYGVATFGYVAVLVSESFGEWMVGQGQWWVAVFQHTVRRADLHYGPFTTQAEAETQIEEFIKPLPRKPCAHDITNVFMQDHRCILCLALRAKRIAEDSAAQQGGAEK